MKRKVNRSSVSGRFVSEEENALHPDYVVTETVEKKSKAQKPLAVINGRIGQRIGRVPVYLQNGSDFDCLMDELPDAKEGDLVVVKIYKRQQ